jgi:hypothetical protein
LLESGVIDSAVVAEAVSSTESPVTASVRTRAERVITTVSPAGMSTGSVQRAVRVEGS